MGEAALAGWYPGLRTLHIAAVMLSGGLFFLRGAAIQAGAGWAMRRPLRYLSYGIDTVLLSAALLLVASLPSALFANGWLTVKLVLLLGYIVAGSLALKRAPTRQWKLVFYLLALVLFAGMYVIARSHDPWAPFTVFAA